MNIQTKILSTEDETETEKESPIQWSSTYAVATGAASIIVAEFLPVSVLTPIANELSITEGMAGQAVSVTALVGVVVCLLIATLRINRRTLLYVFSVLQIISCIVVAAAPNYLFLMLGRVLLGLAVGGFHSMAPAMAMRLVPIKNIPKALSIIFGAISIATVIAAPMGSYFGNLLGWRMVFFIAAGIGLISLIFQLSTLPTMPVDKPVKLSTLKEVVNTPQIKGGLIATLFVFIGYATFFTYLRPFLETIAKVESGTLSLILLGFGISNFFGTTLARYAVSWNLYRSLALVPLLMGGTVAGLVTIGNVSFLAALLTALWGLLFGVVQVGWPAWLTRTIPEKVESAGGLHMAVIQLAVTIGAATGGLVFDITSVKGVFILSSCIFVTAALSAYLAFSKR